MLLTRLLHEQEKNEGLRAAVEAASRGGDASEARLQDQQAYISRLQVCDLSIPAEPVVNISLM